MIKSMTDLPALAAYLQRIGAEPRSLRVAVVKEAHGTYWTDVATIRVGKDGSIAATEGYEPTEAEAVIIKQEVLGAEWPTSVRLAKGYALPAELQSVPKEDLFELKDYSGRLVMIQVRQKEKTTGEKRYVPWSFWSDDQWRKMEPEGPLPLYGMETVGDHTTVFIHEGAKAARAVHNLVNPKTKEEQIMLEAHPWGKELSGAAHIGWIGGALSPARTDWSELAQAGIKRAYIVADNDEPGKISIPRISERLRGIIVFSIEFTELWPASFDLADPFPEKMFSQIGDYTHYTGPTFRDVMHPATWATDMVPNPSGKGAPVAVLRKEFANLWLWIEEADMFICREMPEIRHALAQFNSMVRPFSNVAATGQLLNKSYKGRIAKLCFRPDIKARIVTDRTTSAINLHSPSPIRPIKGDPAPWINFLEYLFPVERERREVERWCATLIARPEIRMLYGMLLVSERQGMGKTTLGERVMAPLVGMNNTGFPGERDIVESNFNGWVANKRLVVIGEIYTGQSFKAYNILKSYLTDKQINVNEKFERPYTIENWTHVIACSNSKKALRIEETDRRWFYPSVSETAWTRAQFGEFYEWIASGGLSIIAHWAENYGDYVLPGAHAPMTISKQALISDSKGEVLNHWIDILEAAEMAEEPVVFALSEVRETMKKLHGKVFETPLQMKKEAIAREWATCDERIAIDGGLSYVVVAPSIKDKLQAIDKADRSAVREFLTSNLQRLGDRVRGM